MAIFIPVDHVTLVPPRGPFQFVVKKLLFERWTPLRLSPPIFGLSVYEIRPEIREEVLRGRLSETGGEGD